MDSTVKAPGHTPRAIKRWTSAAVVIGSTVAVLASPLAIAPAAAATTGVAITPAGTTTTMAHGATATVNYTVTTDNGTETGATSASIVSGPDAGGPVNCGAEAANTPVANTFSGTCTFANVNAGAGPDLLRVTNGASHADASVALTGTKSTTTSVTIDAASQNQNLPAGSSATINVHYLPVPAAGQDAPLLYISTISGSDGAADPAGVQCVTKLDGTGSCTLNDTHGAGQDTITVFADNNGTGTRDATPPADVQSNLTTVTFSGAPAQLSISASSSVATAGTCVLYTINAVDSGGHPSAGQAINVTMNETGSGTPNTPTVTFYNSDCATGADARNAFSGTYSVSQSKGVVTDSNGQVKIGVAAGNAGSGTVVASFGPNVSASQPMTWTAGGSGAVAHLTATPVTRTQYVNTTANFTLHATDSSGSPIQGISVFRQTSAPDSIPAGSCGVTNANGDVVCGVANSGATGTDSVTFWVNNCTTTCTAGPDAGEPQASATAIFNPQPTFTSSGLTCVQQLSGAQQGTGVTNCTISTAQKSVVFTETLKNNGVPVSGAIVTFTATAAKLGGQTLLSNLPSGSGTTDANGVATFTVDDPNAVDGDAVQVSASVGNVPAGSASASWKAPVASALAVTPVVQSVTKGGSVSVTAQVTDQFGVGFPGANVLNYTVSGRNAKSGQVTTDATGSATIAYTDAGTNPLATQDAIGVSDITNPFNGSATVFYLTGSSTAASVVVDSSGLGITDGTCNASGHTPATNVALGATTEVCVLVKNSNSPAEVLAGKSVTITVSNGQVAKHGGLTTTSTSSVTVTTDGAGIAFADVTSTKSGAQTVTATVDSATGSSTVTYQTPAAAQARNIKIAPTTTNVASGAQQKFTATVTDAFGNPVPNVSVLFTQSGPGNIGGQSSATLTTDPSGNAAVTVSTLSTDSGSGSVVGSIVLGAGGSQCGALANAGAPPAATAGNCTATATYTVAKSIVPASLAIQVAGAHKVGSQELIAASVTNSDGSPAVNQLVRFTVSGANSASGSGVTTAKGVAFIAYTPTHAGTDHIAAYDDVNTNGTADAGEPTGTLNVSILSGAKERPSITLTSRHGRVTIHVTTHPTLRGAFVTYYVERLGRFHAIGSNRTGSTGHAHMSFRRHVGQQFTFRVHVFGKSGVAGGTSARKSIRVRA